MESFESLPSKLQGSLADTRISRTADITKPTAREISIGIVELGVVKDVKEFNAEL